MGSNKELWLARHGQTTWNFLGLLAGFSDVPLTAQGEAQAKALRPLLEIETFEGVWSSDLIRAEVTAKLAYGKAILDERLREMNFGKLEGMRWGEIDPEHQNALLEFVDFKAPAGEALNEFEARILSFISFLPGGRHLIFTHGGVIRILTRHLGHDSFVKNGALVAIDWTKEKLLFVKDPLTKH